MSRFNSETPMDFEFQNGTGSIDARSPFAQVSSNAQRFATPGKKRPANAFESPMKSARSAGQQFSPQKPLPPTPSAFNSLFSTPRKPKGDIDDSSAGETPKSPEREDSDATPDHMNLRGALSRFDAQSMPALPHLTESQRQSPQRQRPSPKRDFSFQQQFIGKVKKIWSPGRGEIHRKEQNPDGVEKSIVKRRKRQVDRRVVRRRRHSMSESEADSDYRSVSPRKTSRQQCLPHESENPGQISSFFRFIASQPMLPHILSWYAQLMFNIFILCFCGYIIYSVWAAVQGDIDRSAAEEIGKVMAEVAACAKEYVANHCDPATRMPALEVACNSWARCQERDPTKVGRARISASTFAVIYNSFVDEISWKAILFTSLIAFSTFGFGNLAFGVLRNKAQEQQQQLQQQQHYHPQWQPPPPSTPQHSFNTQDGGFYSGTPWHQPLAGATLEPQPNSGYGQIEGRGSPVRRLAY